MAWSPEKFREQYDKLATFYDPAMWLYRLAGMRIETYRRRAVEGLRLEPGDTVVDLGCGTGLNFRHLRSAVGAGGRIVGVDISPGMLEKARQRAAHEGWQNVVLVEADISEYRFPAATNGVLATLALATVADYVAIIQRATETLPVGTRFANVELKWPERWPEGLARFAGWLNRPAGVTPDIVDRNPASAMREFLKEVSYQEFYFGAAYICSGTVQRE